MSFIGGALAAPGLHFDLLAVGPGVATDCAAGTPATGGSCSINSGFVNAPSPFILTNNGTGTTVTLNVFGTVQDPGDGLSVWSGSFTTQINNTVMTLAQIRTTIITGGSVQSSFSGEFDATAVPEPASMALIGGALLAIAGIKRRRRE